MPMLSLPHHVSSSFGGSHWRKCYWTAKTGTGTAAIKRLYLIFIIQTRRVQVHILTPFVTGILCVVRWPFQAYNITSHLRIQNNTAQEPQKTSRKLHHKCRRYVIFNKPSKMGASQAEISQWAFCHLYYDDCHLERQRRVGSRHIPSPQHLQEEMLISSHGIPLIFPFKAAKRHAQNRNPFICPYLQREHVWKGRICHHCLMDNALAIIPSPFTLWFQCRSDSQWVLNRKMHSLLKCFSKWTAKKY